MSTRTTDAGTGVRDTSASGAAERPTGVIRLGTRRSALATTQAGWVADQLRGLGHQVELVEITTFGDTSTAPLATIGGTGVFASAIRQALQRGEIDLAVHSLKDLPVAPEPGLVVAAIPAREDPRDALVARDGLTLGELPAGSVVGTGSPRRAAQIAALGLGLQVEPVRGNVDTRLRLVHEGSCDAVVLARAGLARLGRLDEVSEFLDPLQMLPAPGQGALAVECRADRSDVLAAVAPLDDADTRACVAAERALLAALEAGCTAPVGALAEVVESEDGEVELSLRAFAGSLDAAVDLRRSVVGPVADAERLGRELAAVLLADGASEISTSIAQPTAAGRPPDPSAAGGADIPLAVPAAQQPPASSPDRPTPERAS
jgi:hydroxymethylbilane synthase